MEDMDQSDLQDTDEAGQKQGLTRRGFLGAAAVAGAAAGFMGAGPVASAFAAEGDVGAATIAWDYETDVLVLGSGPAGMACAANAGRGGASVMVLEMNDKIGGKGILAGGNLGIGGGTRMQKAQGMPETAQIIYEDRTVEALRTDGQTMTVGDVVGGTHKVGQWRKISGCADADGLARVFADRSLDTWDWLDGLGCPFIKANVSAYANVYRGSRYYTTTSPRPVNPKGAATDMQAGGAGLLWPMYDDAVAHGVQFFLSHKMTQIIREGDRSGRVLGVEAKAGDKTLYFRARKAVFLGTGSWNGSMNLKKLFLPWLSMYPHVSGEPYVFNDGSGIEAAIEAGASITTDRGSDWHGWHRHPGTVWHSINLPYGLPGTAEPDDTSCMYVNADGNRFMNEQIGEDNPAWIGGNPPFYFAQICSQQKLDKDGPIVWIILDETARAKQSLDFTVGKTVEQSMYANASTIAELATKINVPAAALTAAVTKYNGYVAGGKDLEFGKAEMSAPVQTAPFHAVKWGIQKHNTLGGVTVNEKAQVMDWSSQVIPGLYASGESAGGMDLIGLAKPIVFGRVAGEWAAKEATPSPAATFVTLKADHKVLARGKFVRLSSVLGGNAGIPAGASVTFEAKKPGASSYAKIATKKVGPGGAASIDYKLVMAGNYSFRTRFLQTADFAASTSKAVTVTAK
jgi:succinate dehydrogenase/fumarate reductase flavoprotein subunit